ncbi:MAG: hypothetical protein L6R40_006811 [Gallowayella cf. fulva]|nr:MAG: hypothetical protein L6R40_006811 [Xanthomendoza cf. fulva]
MGLRRFLTVASAFTLLLGLSSSTPRNPARARQQLSPRQDVAVLECQVGNDANCPGFYPDASPECLASNAPQAIDDIKLLAYAALRALYTKAPKPAADFELPTGPVSPAPHFFYLFVNDRPVAEFVANIFRALLACSEKHDCPFNTVFCDNNRAWPGACSTPAGRYGFVRDPNQAVAALNNRPKGGGSVFLCPAGLALPRNPAPCSAVLGKDSLGSGLLAQLVQVDVITKPDVPFLETHTGWENITVLDGVNNYQTKEAQGMTMAELGFGRNGEGLRERGLANAQNYVEFAKWSYDLGYAAREGATCDEKFEAFVKAERVQPVSG